LTPAGRLAKRMGVARSVTSLPPADSMQAARAALPGSTPSWSAALSTRVDSGCMGVTPVMVRRLPSAWTKYVAIGEGVEKKRKRNNGSSMGENREQKQRGKMGPVGAAGAPPPAGGGGGSLADAHPLPAEPPPHEEDEDAMLTLTADAVRCCFRCAVTARAAPRALVRAANPAHMSLTPQKNTITASPGPPRRGRVRTAGPAPGRLHHAGRAAQGAGRWWRR
jgi:hypothetical protein